MTLMLQKQIQLEQESDLACKLGTGDKQLQVQDNLSNNGNAPALFL